ncbi:efflux RND transporter periplasmic adaptor subunit [Halomonas faecis]|uniref:efflux RND transporter periplasmic adaptor subunit n=1 Tax=Halomonas faecis TaxID=1562110 RepID=UPI0013D1F79D|nr:efflux RND transporter periplasmic adaptor subunit [Halomonas faecis]
MNPMGKYLLVTSLGVLLGVSGTVVMDGNSFIVDSVKNIAAEGDGKNGKGQEEEREPLYWVAPMDPNYKRDKPGKSPMGMDLVPVYEDGDEGDSPGTVKISPGVVNNLGVRTATVEKGVFDTTVRTVGYVQYDEDSLVHIHPRVEGWVEQLFVKAEGERVTQGKPLYSIYSPTLVNAQEELLLALNRDNPGLISAAMARLRALQVPEEAIQSLRQNRQVSQTITLRAPQSGVLDNLEVREGMFVRPGVSMMSIGVLDRVWVVGEVFERQAALIEEGDRVRMTLDYLPDRKWDGVVDYVYPNIDEKTRTARVRMRFSNEDMALKPGMFAQLTVLSESDGESLQIPRESLIRTGDQARVVLALGDGKFKSIEVNLGRVGWEKVEVISGLEEGERIVTSAQFLLDSESSRTSDFRRMEHSYEASGDNDSHEETVWVAASIENVMPNHRMVTLAHDAIEAWQWPAMNMDFSVDESIEMESLKSGMDIHVEIGEVGEGEYHVMAVHVEARPEEESDMTEMNHDQHGGESESGHEPSEHASHASHTDLSAPMDAHEGHGDSGGMPQVNERHDSHDGHGGHGAEEHKQ